MPRSARDSQSQADRAIRLVRLQVPGFREHGYAMYQALDIDTMGARQNPRNAAGEDPVVVAGDESFPASDPPSWTPVAGTAARHQPAT